MFPAAIFASFLSFSCFSLLICKQVAETENVKLSRWICSSRVSGTWRYVQFSVYVYIIQIETIIIIIIIKIKIIIPARSLFYSQSM